MRLIGMLDSPFVRRVAVCLEHHGIAFRHEAVSVFSTFGKFQSINPVVKAPTLVCDDGTLLMDSSLILQHIEATQTGGRTLWPSDPLQMQYEMRTVGLAQAACEKSAQLVYERNLRPAAAQHEPWAARVTGQLLAAYRGLEQEIALHPQLFRRENGHAAIAAAIAWQFTQSLLAQIVPAADYPGVAGLSARMERTAQFLKYPPAGPGVPKPA